MDQIIHIIPAVGPSLTSSAAVSAEPREFVATPWVIFIVDVYQKCLFLALSPLLPT